MIEQHVDILTGFPTFNYFQVGSKSLVPNLIVISDAETMIGYGNAFASMVEKSNQTFGSLLCLEAVFCFVMSVIHFYLFTPIVTVTRLWDSEQVNFSLINIFLPKYFPKE